MRVLSASEAISPAIERTKSTLFQPFQKGRSWKIAATAYLTMMGNIFLPTHLAFLTLPRQGGFNGLSFLFIVLIFGVLATVLLFVFFYIGARLQFVLFDMVLTRSKMVAPLWRKYGFCTWRWIGLKFALSIGLLIVFGVPVFSSFRLLMAHLPSPGQPPSPDFMSGFFLAYAVMLLAISVMMLLASLLNDFILPPIALENVTIVEGLHRFFELARREPGQLIAYIFFKSVLAIAAAIATEIAVIVAELVVAIPLGIVAFVGWLLLHSLKPAGPVLLFCGGAVLFVIFLALVFYVTTGFFGIIMVFFQSYALYFLGGRYHLLGDLLEPPAPEYAFAAQPPPYNPPPSPMSV
jgi:hypothetical protein